MGLTSVSLTDPLVVTDVLSPLVLRSLAKGSVTPERKGRLTLPSRFLAVVVGGGGGGVPDVVGSPGREGGGGGGGRGRGGRTRYRPRSYAHLG